MKICFVAHNVFPFFYNRRHVGRIGGAELQQKLIAEALATRGVKVSFISSDVGQAEIVQQSDITFIRSYSEHEGIPGIRFFYPRLYKLWKSLKKADADIYYVRCAGFMPGVLALFCKRHGKKFIFAGASDTDFQPGQELVRLPRDRWLYRFGLRHAAKIFVQSYHQKRLLQNNYGLEGIIVRNYYRPVENYKTRRRNNGYILWVSSIKKLKRPLLFVELAKSLPEQKFIMVGGAVASDQHLFTAVQQASSEIGNLKFMGFQPIDEVEKLFDQCSVFVNTSEFEGFPNTFLQAWGRGIPVVSYVDPDNIIETYGLGKTVTDEEGLKNSIEELIVNQDNYTQKIKKYFYEEHSENQINKYVSIFIDLVKSN